MSKFKNDDLDDSTSDQSIIDEVSKLTRILSLLKLSNPKIELSDILLVCNKLVKFSNFVEGVKSVPSIGLVIQKGSIEFSKYILKNPNLTKNIETLFKSILDSDSRSNWLDFIITVKLFKVNKLDELILSAITSEFLDALITLFLSFKNYEKITSLKHDSFTVVMQELLELISAVSDNQKPQIHTILNGKKLVNLFNEIINAENGVWKSTLIQVLEVILLNYQDSDIFKVIYSSKLLITYLDILSVLHPGELSYSASIFHAMSIILKACEKNIENSNVCKIFNDFEQSHGYQICVEHLVKGNEVFELYRDLFQDIVDILVILSYSGDAESSGFVLLFKKKTHSYLIRNVNSINILVTFFVENNIEEYNLKLINIISNYLLFNEKNLSILISKGILNVVIINIIFKSQNTQTALCDLISTIFKNHMNEVTIQEMSALSEVIRCGDLFIRRKLIGIFSKYVTSNYFICILVDSNCLDCILDILRELYAARCRQEVVGVFELLVKVVKTYGISETIKSSEDSLKSAWDFSISEQVLLDCTCEMILLFIEYGSVRILEYLVLKFHTDACLLKSYKLELIKNLSVLICNNSKAIELFQKNKGFEFLIEQINHISAVSVIDNHRSEIDSSLISIVDYLNRVLGLVMLLLDYLYQKDVFYLENYFRNYYLELEFSIFKFECFQMVINQQSLDSYHLIFLKNLIRVLFLLSFDDYSIFFYNFIDNFLSDPNVQTGYIKHPVFIVLILKIADFISENSDSLLTDILEFILSTVKNSFVNRFNSQKMNSYWCLDKVIPILIAMKKKQERFSEMIDVIINLDHALSFLFSLFTYDIPFMYLSVFLKQNLQSCDYWRLYNKVGQIDVLQYYPLAKVSTSQMLSETTKTICESSASVFNTSFDEGREIGHQSREVLDTIDESSRVTSIIVNESGRESELFDWKNMHAIETVTENSQQWEAIQNILLSSMDTSKLTETEIDPWDDTVKETDSEVHILLNDDQNNNFGHMISLVTDLQHYLMNLKDNHINMDEFCFKFTNKELSFINIPKTIKNTFFHKLKYKKGEKEYAQEFSCSIWFKYDPKLICDTTITLISLTHDEVVISNDKVFDVNVLTVIYHTLLNMIIVTTEPRIMKELNLVNSARNNVHRSSFKYPIENNQWQHCAVIVDGSHSNKGQSTIHLYMNGSLLPRFNQYFEIITNNKQYLTAKIGTTLPSQSEETPYHFGPIIIANKIFSGQDIKQIYQNGLNELNYYGARASNLIEHNLYIEPTICYVSDTKILCMLEPRRNVLVHDFSCLIDSKNIEGVTSLHPLKNSMFSENFKYGRKRKRLPIYTVCSLDYTSFSISTMVNLGKSLFLSGGIGKFVMLIEQSYNSQILFNNLDLLFNFVITFYDSISIYVTNKDIGAITLVIKTKKHLIDIRIVLLIISFMSNRISLSQSFLYTFIVNLIIDLEFWFTFAEEITQEILKFIRNSLLEPMISPIPITIDFIEDRLIEPLLISFINCPIKQSSQKIFYEIISVIFQKFLNNAVICKFIIIAYEFGTSESTRKFSLPSSVSEQPNNTSSDNVALSILELIRITCLEENAEIEELLCKSVGIYPFILLTRFAQHPKIACLSFEIFVFILKCYSKNSTDFTDVDSSLIKHFRNRSYIFTNDLLGTPPSLAGLYFYIGKMLSISNVPSSICISYLVPGYNNVKDSEKLYSLSLLDQNVQNITYLCGVQEFPKNISHFELFIAGANYFHETFKHLQNDTIDSRELNDYLLSFIHFLELIHFLIISEPEAGKIFAQDKFIYSIVNTLFTFRNSTIAENNKNVALFISELILKICISIYEYMFNIIGKWNVSDTPKESYTYSSYPQTSIYFMIRNGSHDLSLPLIALLCNRILDSISNNTHLGNLLKACPERISMISELVLGHCLCFGSIFEADIFSMLLRLARLIFTMSDDKILPYVLEFSSKLNKYISNLLVFDPKKIQEYSNRFYSLIPLFSANAHILFINNCCDKDTLGDVMSLLFLHILFVSLQIEANFNFNYSETSDQAQVLFFKETFQRLRSVYELFLQFHLEKFKECLYMTIGLMLTDDSTIMNEFEQLIKSPSKLFQAIRRGQLHIKNYEEFQSYIMLKCDLDIFKNENFHKYSCDKWSENSTISLWFSNVSQFMKTEYLLSICRHHNYQIILTTKLQSYLSEIQESLYHDGNKFEHVEHPEQRYESLNSFGYFGTFIRLRKNSDFYFNHIIRNQKSGRRELKSKSEYTTIYQENLTTYFSNFINSPIHDVSSLLSNIYRRQNIKSLYMLEYYLKKDLSDDNKNQEILQGFNIARIHRLEAIEGVLLMLTNGLLIIDGLCISSQNVIVNSVENQEISTFTNFHVQKRYFNLNSFHKYIPYEEIVCLRKRWYSLLSCAVEIFDYDNYSILVAFKKSERKLFVNTLTRYLKKHGAFYQSKQENNNLFLYFEPFLVELLDLKIKKVQERWIEGKIDNFTYILYLNIRAGRTFNDFSQYPIFPWILSNYQSRWLDFENEKFFRDLSKPMGAQSPERLKAFLLRYEEWDNIAEQLPKFMYATFFSTSMNTCGFMVRMEPFSSSFIQLQGGSFDLPDRMFHSLQDSYNSSAHTGSADVKELIPEFFYFPEFLKNSNKFIFGPKQSGQIVNDVILPPWARGNPREFIRLNRMAIESDYVSRNINNWIDLVFGYKQSGKHAIKSNNVYHSWFYKGSVNLENVCDPTVKNSIISFINNFGQAPKKLFIEPHPKRKINNNKNHINNIFQSDEPRISKISEHPPVRISDVQYINHKLQVAYNCQILIPPYFKNKLSWEFLDNNLYYFDCSGGSQIYKMLDTSFHGIITICLFLNVKYLAIGLLSGNISIWRYDIVKDIKTKFHKLLQGHTGAITCLAASSSQKFMISGAKDGYVYQWDLIDFTFIRRISLIPNPIITLSIVYSTSDIVIFQENSMHVYCVNGELVVRTDTGKKVIFGIPINNELQDDYQYLAISTNEGIEIWQYGYDPSEYNRRNILERDDKSLELPNVNSEVSPSVNPPHFSFYRTINLKKYLQNEEYVTALRVDHDHFSLYAGTNQGNIFIIKSCTVNTTQM